MGLDVYLRFLLAFGATLGLLVVLYWVVRRYGTRLMLHGSSQGRRIGVVEISAVDPRRRLVLLRRDDVEHLVLLGATGDLVVETGITPPKPASPTFKETVRAVESVTGDGGKS